jgi:hypothetical protein
MLSLLPLCPLVSKCSASIVLRDRSNKDTVDASYTDSLTALQAIIDADYATVVAALS